MDNMLLHVTSLIKNTTCQHMPLMGEVQCFLANCQVLIYNYSIWNPCSQSFESYVVNQIKSNQITECVLT